MDPSDTALIGAAVDLAGLAGSGTAFTPVKLPKVVVGSKNYELDNLINSGGTSKGFGSNAYVEIPRDLLPITSSIL
ncbi:hypothetical protein PsAD2_03558 [Pseudovibrio axinellae]|uniref:Uncharacterized protein n=2 Tax=Pseudovibrio axinellae TaxID=989403 RepID=A0A165VZJ5_9HYPH|nr:hypothetical protein PsAD2_03558 [Pseudovibrio axinellae]